MLKSSHNLEFRVSAAHNSLCQRFDIGTIEGYFSITEKGYEVYSVYNRESGNGHIEDFLEWFDYLAKINNNDLLFMDVFNRRFKKHLIEKREFIALDEDHLIKKHH